MAKISPARLMAILSVAGAATLSLLFQNCAGGDLESGATEDSVENLSTSSTPTPVPSASPGSSPTPLITIATPTPGPTPGPTAAPTATPVVLNAGEKVLCRGLSPQGFHTLFGTGCTPGGVVENVLFVGASAAGAGLHPIYLCHVNPSVDIVSTDVNCEAGRVVGFKLLIGYFADAPSAAMPRSVRRCHHPVNGDFLVTYDISECTNNGYDVEGSLGYGR